MQVWVKWGHISHASDVSWNKRRAQTERKTTSTNFHYCSSEPYWFMQQTAKVLLLTFERIRHSMTCYYSTEKNQSVWQTTGLLIMFIRPRVLFYEHRVWLMIFVLPFASGMTSLSNPDFSCVCCNQLPLKVSLCKSFHPAPPLPVPDAKQWQ
jgi:hypothetical protein